MKSVGVFCSLCSEQEAKEKIYSASTTLYTGFGVAVSWEIALVWNHLAMTHIFKIDYY